MKTKLLKLINSIKVTTRTEITNKIGMTDSAMTPYLRSFEQQGYVANLGGTIVRVNIIPEDFRVSDAKRVVSEDEIEFNKVKALNKHPNLFKVAPVIEQIAYMQLIGIKEIDIMEFNEKSGKHPTYIKSAFNRLALAGVIQSKDYNVFKFNYRIRMTRTLKDAVLGELEPLKTNIVKKVAKVEDNQFGDLSWIERLADEMWFEDEEDKRLGVKFMKESALCI